ncbi:MAG: hypothetical protein HYY45_06950 [Deltaproteobacteria bacterium]|nr:hypothetical protein [Deltaproteobacteria bacterium]
MNNIETVTQFRQLIAEFKEKEQLFIRAFQDDDFENPVFGAIDDLVIKIKERLADYDVLRVDDLSLRNDLCAIRENKDFRYFQLLELINKANNPGSTAPLVFRSSLSPERWHEILADDVLSQVDPNILITRKMEIGALLVGKTIPAHIEKHLILIKECYAWSFDSAAAIYCRTVLEEGFKEALKSRPEFRTPAGKKDLEEWSLDWLLNHSKKKKYFYLEAIERAYKIKENVNHLVHPTSAKQPVTRMSSMEIIKDAFYILEILFR